ncbi:MAG TPA: tyrosine-type recombinase/integrase [Planctomycetota bacterium]|nr:tyrosine-type recombinase/integrase [Planctomycetota bacterium]
MSLEEVHALLGAPNLDTWTGRRDHVLLATLYNTGARVSEAIGLDVAQIHLDRTPRVCLHGKGRKERTVPLWKTTAQTIAKWNLERQAPPDAPLFPNRNGQRLTRSGVAQRLALAVAGATRECPSLKGRRISPHTLRHTTALHLLEAGNDISLIALWLGHESPNTTHAYLEANVALKERVLARVTPLPGRRGRRFKASDSLLAFLDGDVIMRTCTAGDSPPRAIRVAKSP